MIGVIGGCWIAGLIGAATVGIPAGAILFGIGCIAASCKLAQERQAAKAAASWRKNYPTYKY